ncbi:MAG: hypothetical protein GWM90_24525, partial [Gemmatimonadetes bacterium]|nr:hypothetical protein [Gemmatimonadota bacterium]NIQ57943.1 hypothetical protein [Gemmatimonadota bacterium]NIU78119.1 hypothetical protein [Gammaproteobacteria bacterium]NIX19524.1 hypothetical protein [Actinomycetota bacterium]NIX47125.1 hypothetical protein [Gemmatimonadota bacterium]
MNRRTPGHPISLLATRVVPATARVMATAFVALGLAAPLTAQAPARADTP